MLTTTEMTAWWRVWKEELPTMNPEEADAIRATIEDMTGCIPWLLSRLLIHPPGTSFRDIEDKFWADQVIRTPALHLEAFMNDGSKTIGQHGLRLLYAYLLEKSVPSRDTKLVDRRYLYEDARGVGHVTCGIVREALNAILRDKSTNLSLPPLC